MPCWRPYGYDLLKTHLVGCFEIVVSKLIWKTHGETVSLSHSIASPVLMIWSILRTSGLCASTKDLEEQLDFHEARVSFSIRTLFYHGIFQILIFLTLLSLLVLGLSQGDRIKGKTYGKAYFPLRGGHFLEGKNKL